jgi:NAD(P)-dependent dehydrogenase (short-subunit alcohol dehydrogenase family)
MTTNKQKVALVTGASSGIGYATALKLNEAGFMVYAAARRPESLKELEAKGCRPVKLDVTDDAQRVAAIKSIEAQHGAIDVLINNAGYGEMGAIEEIKLENWRRQFETNVFGVARLIQLALPAMRAKGRGRIINISSGGGEFTFPLAGAYHATKYALESISDALRFEVKPFGIDVVVIQPGAVRTPLADKTVEAIQTTPDSPYAALVASFRKMSEASIQAGRGYMTPEAVAEVILKAAQSKRPATRYKLGAMPRAMSLLRHILPDRAWDTMLNRMYRPGKNPAQTTNSRVEATS